MSETVPARPESDNTDPPTPFTDTSSPPDRAPPPAATRTYEVVYAFDLSGLAPPRLLVFDANPAVNAVDDLKAAGVQWDDVGEIDLPRGLTAAEVERAAFDTHGSHVGKLGRPAWAELVDADLAGRLVGQVAACIWSWPALAGPGRRAGGPTAANVAAAVRANPADVEDVFRRFSLGGPSREESAAALGDAIRMGLLKKDARGRYYFTAAGRVARDLAWDGAFARVAAAIRDWPCAPNPDGTPPIRRGGRA